MAAAPVRPFSQPPLHAVALVGDEVVDPAGEVQSRRERARVALTRARERLSESLLREIWTDAATLDVAVWGHAVTGVEADRTLREAAERGVIAFDPTPADGDDGGERGSRLRGVLRRLTGARV